MPPCLSSWTMTTSGLPGTISLPWCIFPFPPVFSIPVVLCSQSGPKVKTVVKYTQGKLAVAWRECKQVLVHILEKAGGSSGGSSVILMIETSQTLSFLYVHANYLWSTWSFESCVVRSNFNPMEMYADIQNSLGSTQPQHFFCQFLFSTTLK